MSEGRVYEVNLGFSEPCVPSPWEQPAFPQESCPLAFLETQTKEIRAMYKMFADQANQNGLAQLAWDKLITRKPTTLTGFRHPETLDHLPVRTMLARNFPNHSEAEIAFIGFYPDGQPQNVSFEAIASRSPQYYASKEFFTDEMRQYGLDPERAEYTDYAEWMFFMVDLYLAKKKDENLDHVDDKIFRVPYNKYEMSPSERDWLVGLQEEPDTFVRMPDHYYLPAEVLLQ